MYVTSKYCKYFVGTSDVIQVNITKNSHTNLPIYLLNYIIVWHDYYDLLCIKLFKA